nr:MAG TPA: hypothetical protein [Caudoviricetes sp.]
MEQTKNRKRMPAVSVIYFESPFCFYFSSFGLSTTVISPSGSVLKAGSV